MQELQNFVNSELADQILKASNWLDTECQLVKYSLRDEPIVLPMPKGDLDAAVLAGSVEWKLPAYSIGYLLRKLPTNVTIYKSHEAAPDLQFPAPEVWHATFASQTAGGFNLTADNPESALAQLILAMFQANALQKAEDATA